MAAVSSLGPSIEFELRLRDPATETTTSRVAKNFWLFFATSSISSKWLAISKLLPHDSQAKKLHLSNKKGGWAWLFDRHLTLLCCFKARLSDFAKVTTYQAYYTLISPIEVKGVWPDQSLLDRRGSRPWKGPLAFVLLTRDQFLAASHDMKQFDNLENYMHFHFQLQSCLLVHW